MLKGKKILVVDDELDILDLLAFNFKKENMLVFTADNGKDALLQAKKHSPDIILLDVMLPDMDGMEICEELRKSEDSKDSLILFLSARGEDYSQLAGFKAGADDYVVKPVRIKILIEKIKALIKRTSDIDVQQLITGSIEIDKTKFTVTQNGVEHIIPKKEFELLALLMQNSEKVYRREEILEQVWGLTTFVGDRTIDVHIRKLREKFGQSIIRTVKGIGYKFEDI